MSVTDLYFITGGLQNGNKDSWPKITTKDSLYPKLIFSNISVTESYLITGGLQNCHQDGWQHDSSSKISTKGALHPKQNFFYNISYLMTGGLQYIWNPVPESYDERMPAQSGQSNSRSHILMSQPAASQVSSWVIQTSGWIPRSIHCLLVWFKVNAEFTW